MLAAAVANNATAQTKAQDWNRNVIGWNLGNQFECSAP